MKKICIYLLTISMLFTQVLVFADDETKIDENTEITAQTEDNADKIADENSAVAENGNVEEDALTKSEPITYEISLEDAINMAYEDNAELKSNELSQMADEISIESQRISKLRAKNTSYSISANFAAYCTREGYYLSTAEMTARINKKAREQLLGTIAYNVTNSYYNMILLQKKYNAAYNSYELVSNNLNVLDAEYNMGMVPQIDYENALLAKRNCQNVLTICDNAYKLAEQNFKISLNKSDENCNFVLTDEIECGDYSSDNKSDIDSAMDSRYDLYALMEKRDNAKEYFDLTNALTDRSADYNTAYASYVVADSNYTNAKKMTAVLLQSEYNDVITSKESMEIAQLTYELNLKQYDSTKLKYELGMISNIDLTQAINDLYDAQTSYAEAKLTYRMAVEKYKCEITTGL